MKNKNGALVRDVDNMSAEELRVHAEQAKLHLRALMRLLPGLFALNAKERDDLQPELCEGEPEAIRAVLAVADIKPEEFLGADIDDDDDEPFDTHFYRERLRVYEEIKPLRDELATAVTQISDHLLAITDDVRLPVQLVCSTAQRVAATNREMRKIIKPATKFYR